MHVANAVQIREPDLAQLYAQALVAIARADDHLGLEEGLRLQQKIDARLATPIAIDAKPPPSQRTMPSRCRKSSGAIRAPR